MPMAGSGPKAYGKTAILTILYDSLLFTTAGVGVAQTVPTRHNRAFYAGLGNR